MIRSYTSTPAAQVKVGDCVFYFDGPSSACIDRITAAESDGWIGLYSDNSNWSIFLKPTDTIRVLN